MVDSRNAAWLKDGVTIVTKGEEGILEDVTAHFCLVCGVRRTGAGQFWNFGCCKSKIR